MTRKKFPDELSELICDSFVSFMCGLSALTEVVDYMAVFEEND